MFNKSVNYFFLIINFPKNHRSILISNIMCIVFKGEEIRAMYLGNDS